MGYPPRARFSIPLSNRTALILGDRPLVMGVINLTPDSFAGGALLRPDEALSLALTMEDEGADLIDIGGESTRPGAAPVAADEERARVIPALTAIASRLRIPISVDTTKAAVALDALEAGAAIVNDISGLQFDPSLGGVVAATGAALVLMHTRGRSTTMQANAVYGDDPAVDVVRELQQAIGRATAAGVSCDSIIVDPGIGFAKRAEHSYGVLAALPEIARALDRPVLVGPSRKSFMSAALDGRPAHERDWGTAAAVTASVLAGAHIVRVHTVGAMTQVVRVAEEIRRHAQFPHRSKAQKA